MRINNLQLCKNFFENISKITLHKTGYPSIDKVHFKDYSFTERNPIIPNISIYNALRLISNSYKNDYAIDCLDKKITYSKLFEESITLSKTLKELGVKEKDIVAVSMPNFYQAVAIFLAANRIGATTTFLDCLATTEDITRYLNEFESPILLNYNKDDGYNENIKKNTKVENIITLHNSALNNVNIDCMETKYSISYGKALSLAKFQKGITKTLYGGKQDALILFTSGTTGNPKAVVLTNNNILASGIYMKNATHLSNVRGEKSLVCVPFTYPYGFATSTLMSLLCGREAILAPNISAENVVYYLEKNPNIVFGSPALLELIKRNTPSNLNLSSIDTFISGGDFLTQTQAEEAKIFFKSHRADVKICNGSGNAETVGASTNHVGIPIRPETVGKILVGSDAIIIDETTNNELKYGQEGLLCISGKHVFKEYFNNPGLTEQVKFKYKGKTYFKTGTRGILDKDGYFTLTGRDSRYYIISTLNKVYCDRVQNIMSNIDIIDSVAVVKKPDKEMLYTGKAFIVLKKGIEPSEKCKDYIFEKCQKAIITLNGEKVNLKPYEIPKSIEFCAQLPRTKADKIDYAAMEENAQKEFENEQKHIAVYKIK